MSQPRRPACFAPPFCKDGEGNFVSQSQAICLHLALQCGAAVAALVALQYEPAAVPSWVNATLIGFLVLTVVFTVYSGAGYVRSAARILRVK